MLLIAYNFALSEILDKYCKKRTYETHAKFCPRLAWRLDIAGKYLLIVWKNSHVLSLTPVSVMSRSSSWSSHFLINNRRSDLGHLHHFEKSRESITYRRTSVTIRSSQSLITLNITASSFRPVIFYESNAINASRVDESELCFSESIWIQKKKAFTDKSSSILTQSDVSHIVCTNIVSSDCSNANV